MAATACTAARLSSPPGVGGLDNEDSNISSPLSEVDDKDDNDDELEHMQLDRHMTAKSSPIARKDVDAGYDSDSVLSDARSDVQSDANDTEAETERLYDTPKHQRQRDVVVDQYNDGQVLEHTPSKLRSAAFTADDEDTAGQHDDDSMVGDDVSVGSAHNDEEPHPKHVSTGSSANRDSRESQEHKRKRSSAADQMEIDEPLSKRTGSAPLLEEVDHPQDGSTGRPQRIVDAAVQRRNTHSPHDDGDASPQKKASASEDDMSERITRASRKNRRVGSRRKLGSAADVDHDVDIGSHDDNRDSVTGNDAEHAGDDLDADLDDEADVAAAHDEESKFRVPLPCIF